MSLNKKKIGLKAATGAAKGGAAGAAGAVLSGLALTQVPVTVMWIPVAATVVISWPVVLGVGAAAAVITGTACAVSEIHRQSKIQAEFDELATPKGPAKQDKAMKQRKKL